MKDEFPFNDDRNQQTRIFQTNEGAFPPRSTIHNIKDEDAPKNNRLSKIIFSSAGFLIVLAVILFFALNGDHGDKDGKKDPPPNGGSQTEQPSAGDKDEDPTVDPDDIIIEPSPPEEGTKPVDPPTEETPPASGETPTPPVTSGTTHTVKPGETLFSISQKYYGSGYVDKLAEYNNIGNPALLVSGTVLKIPNKELLK
jgi:LysM repeat protein